MRDLHVLPREKPDAHIQSEDCPCGPTRQESGGITIWAHRAADGRHDVTDPAAAQQGIQFRPGPSCPIEGALVDWMRSATLRKDGEATHEGIALVGTEEHRARHYARLIGDHVKAHGPDIAKLAAYLRDPRGAGAHVRVWTHADHVAESAIHELRQRGLL